MAISAINTTQEKRPNGTFAVPSTMLPQGERNHCLFNQYKVGFIASQKENSLPYIKEVLRSSQDENDVVEALYIADKLIDNGTKGIPRMYPEFAKFNNTDSKTIQVMLAGIYRKILVPDAFGPLVTMLIRNAQENKNLQNERVFDSNEEIGGAILEYIKTYSTNPPKIDYTA